MDYKSVANKIVSYIIKMNDDEITSFNYLLKEFNYTCDKQEVYKIINIVNTKLNAQGLFLDFGNPNERKGHIEAIGFRKGKAKRITIYERYYNGKFEIGSIFDRTNEFVLEHDNARIKTELKYYYDREVKDLASVCVTIPFYFDDEREARLKELLEKLEKDDDCQYNESHYSTKFFDYNRYNYCDVKINDKSYELFYKHPLLLELKDILNVRSSDDIVLNTYNNFIRKY